MEFVSAGQELHQQRAGWWERLSAAIPELAALEGVPQPPEYHAEGDVAVHSRLTVGALPVGSAEELLWAALLHDVGKASTTRTVGGRLRSIGHATAGAAVAEAVLLRLGAEARLAEEVAWLVRFHHFHHSWGLKTPEAATARHRRFVANERFPLLLELLRADSVASVGNPRGLRAYELYAALRSQVENRPDLVLDSVKEGECRW